MKKNFLFVSLAFLCVTLGYSQSTITLNSSNFPKPGDSSDVKNYVIPATQSFTDSTSANDSLTIDRTLEKALETLNDNYMKNISEGGYQKDTIPVIIYSQLPGSKSYRRVYQAPNAFTPGGTNFPTTNIYYFSETSNGPAYTYLENNDDGFYELGAYLMPNGQPPTSMVNNPKKPVVTFPVDYNNPDNVPTMKITSSFSGISINTTYEASVDAYGTLYLVHGNLSNPDVTPYDFLRLVQYSKDTLDLGSDFFYYIESKYYSYYVPECFDPIIVYSVAKIRSNVDPMFWSQGFGKWEDEIEVQWNKKIMGSGVNNLNKELSLNLFPNPSTGLFKLDMPAFNNTDINVSVYDISGKLVFENVYNNGLIQIDLSNQPIGMYSVRVVANDVVMNSKMVISR